jgi:hypothetical protein
VTELAQVAQLTRTRIRRLYVDEVTSYDRACESGQVPEFPELAALRKLGSDDSILHLNSDQLLSSSQGTRSTNCCSPHSRQGGRLAGHVLQFATLARILTTIVPGSVEEERLFSAMNFLKHRLHSRLTTGLVPACVQR